MFMTGTSNLTYHRSSRLDEIYYFYDAYLAAATAAHMMYCTTSARDERVSLPYTREAENSNFCYVRMYFYLTPIQ